MKICFSRTFLVAFFISFILIISGPVFAQESDAQPVQSLVQTNAQSHELEMKRQAILELIKTVDDVETMRKLFDFFVVQNEVRAHFVDDKTSADLLDLAMTGMVDGLDPYSSLFIGKSAESLNAQFREEQKYVGIGVTITALHKYIYIAEVRDKSPAAEAGLVAGDLIVKVGDKNLYGMNTAEVSNLIKGDNEEGSFVVLEIKNRRTQKPKVVNVVRRAVVVESISVREDLGKDIVYARIRSFVPAEEVVKRFADVLEKSTGKKLIIDLRGNGGGSLDAVNRTVGFLTGSGKLLITVRGRDGEDKVLTPNLGTTVQAPKKIVILIDNTSASASEIMAGNLQYYKLADLVGIRTFGKAVAQEYLGLDTPNHSLEGSKLILGITFERYYLPDGTDINGNGVQPDVEVEQPDDFQPFDYLTKKDKQFQEALKILKKK